MASVETELISSLQDLRAWVFRFSKKLQGNELILLRGSLGVGKTTLVQMLAQVLGGDGTSSPTYTFHQRYFLSQTDKVLDHWDLYRVRNEEDLESTGFWESIEMAPGLVCIEWPERASNDWPKGASGQWPEGKRQIAIQIEISSDDQTQRRIQATF